MSSNMIRVSLLYFLVYFASCRCDASDSQMMGDPEPHDEYEEECRKYKDKECKELSNMCLKCEDYTTNCLYGNWSTVHCTLKIGITCRGDVRFEKQARCVFCYQTEKWEHTCTFNQNHPCSSQTKFYRANCTAKPEVMCLGPRKFGMRLRCNVTRGHRWSTALILSITLGGFGADRFYLGHWQEGIGKLFSFGGLGVWTLVDVLLIAIRYLGPADGTLYV